MASLVASIMLCLVLVDHFSIYVVFVMVMARMLLARVMNSEMAIPIIFIWELVDFSSFSFFVSSPSLI